MTASCLRIGAFLLPGLILGVTTASPGHARSLDREECEKLAEQRLALAREGVETAIVKGPEWTRANKPADMLARVQQYLEIEEKLRFRCSGMPLPDLEPEDIAGPRAPAADPGTAPPSEPKKKTSAAQPDKPEAARQPAPAVPAPSVAPKAKVDDVDTTASTKPARAAVEPETNLPLATDPPAAARKDETTQPEAAPVPLLGIPLPDRRPDPRVRRVAPAPRKSSPEKKKSETIDPQLLRLGN